MKYMKFCLLLIAVGITGKSWSQDLLNTISKAETERIEKYLSSDELEGRKTFSKGIDKAAAFIANEFAQAGLATFKNSTTYLQSFSRMSAKFISASGNFDGNALDQKNIIVYLFWIISFSWSSRLFISRLDSTLGAFEISTNQAPLLRVIYSIDKPNTLDNVSNVDGSSIRSQY